MNERAWAKIKLENIAHNALEIKRTLQDGVKLMAVIKADGYGHGDLKTAMTLENLVDYFGVATFDEGMNLRKNGITKNILILGFTPHNKFENVIRNNLEQTIFDYETAVKLSSIAKNIGKQSYIHIKVDTGMSRLGFLPNQKSIETILEISKLPNVNITGIFTHFASADDNPDLTETQFKKFTSLIDSLKQSGLDIPIRHASNSAAILNHPEYNLDMVRAGLLLFGISPAQNPKTNLNLRHAMTVKSQIVSIKEIEKGSGVSYGHTFIAKKNTRIGIISIGYADGYPRAMSNNAKVIVRNKFADVIGNICMDQLIIDLSDIPTACIGDEVILMGESGTLKITADQIAQIKNSISYEVICCIGKRIPRLYV